MPGIKRVPGLRMPRLATPRLGLSTKRKPAKNPFGANKMTIKAASLSSKYQDLLTAKEASGKLSLSEFLLLRELEKEAGIIDASLAAAGRLGTRIGSKITQLAGKATGAGQRAAERAADAALTPSQIMGKGMRSAPHKAAAPPPTAAAAPPPTLGAAATPAATPGAGSVVKEVSGEKGIRPLANTQPVEGAAKAVPEQVPKDLNALSSKTPSNKTFADVSKGPSAPAPGAADQLLSGVIKAAPIGVAGGLAGYGALRGWGEGQAEVNRSMQQGFNPATRF
jgi:hypothetical protein